MVGIILQLLERLGATGKKSTALQPLIWIALVATGGLWGILYVLIAYPARPELLSLAKGPVWILSGIMGLCMFSVIAITVHSIWYGKTDLLRSEHYFLQKYAIERGDKQTLATERGGSDQMASDKKD